MKSFIISFLCLSSFLSTARVVEKIEALIDDQMITRSELQEYRRFLRSDIPYSSYLFKLRSKKSLIQNKKLLLDHLIDEKVLWTAFSSIQEKDFFNQDEVFQSFLKKSNLTQSSLLRKLKKIGMDLDQYKEILYRNQVYQEWIRAEIISSIQVGTQDINEDYFQRNKKDLFKNYKYEFLQWTFDLSQEGKSQAQDFLNSSKNIKAEEKSLGSSQMHPSLKKALESLVPGQFSEITCFSKNCYVFKLTSKSFLVEENRQTQKIRTRLFDQFFLAQLKSWVQGHRENAMIKKYL